MTKANQTHEALEDTILHGIAECLWCSAWADHAEESGCTSLSGLQIEEIAPLPWPEAFAHASSLAEAVCKASGADSLHSLLAKLLNAEGVPELQHASHRDNFGWCIAHMSIGSGVSWFDDHPDSADLVVPSLDFCLEDAVASACGCQEPK